MVRDDATSLAASPALLHHGYPHVLILSLFLHCDRRVAHTLWYHCHCLCSFSVQVWRHQNLDAAVQA